MKNLTAITKLPFVSPSGKIIAQPGYHPETEIYAHFDHEALPAIPDNPTPDQIIGAIQVAMQPWSKYRFASVYDRGAMLAAILTAVCRPALDVAPGFFLDAPQQASGKTKAAEALGALIKGQRPGITPFVGGPQADAELAKKIVAMAMVGETFCLVDNVTGLWKSPVLAGLITSGHVNERVLGGNRWYRGGSRTMVVATGNNAELDLDLGRRFIRVRIDAGVECPQAREFSFDPVEMAKMNRLAIAHAALVIVQGYHAAGAPALGRGDAGGFSTWNRLVRRVVLWASVAGYTEEAGYGAVGDPAHSLLESASADDPETAALRSLLVALHETIGAEPFTARDVLTLYSQGRGEVFDALSGILLGRRDVSATSVGRVLLHRRDRITGGMVLRKLGEDRRGVVWSVASE